MNATRLARERLAAHIASHLTAEAIGKGHGTFGEIVDETVRRVDEACWAGRLGIAIREYERDPDD